MEDKARISINIDEIGQKWGALLTQAMVQTAQLEAQVRQYQAQIAQAHQRIAALEDELRRLQPVQSVTWDAPPGLRDGNKKAAPVDGSLTKLETL